MRPNGGKKVEVTGTVGKIISLYVSWRRGWRVSEVNRPTDYRKWRTSCGSEWSVKVFVSVIFPIKQPVERDPRRRVVDELCIAVECLVRVRRTIQHARQMQHRRVVETARNVVCPAEVLQRLLMLTLHSLQQIQNS